MLAVIYCEQNLLFVHPDHLCFDRTTYDNINGPGGPFMFDIIGPAGPLMYPDQIFRYSIFDADLTIIIMLQWINCTFDLIGQH